MAGTFGELSGFASRSPSTAPSGSTYAYIYSTSHAMVVGDPVGSAITAGGVTATLSNFPQVYVVGAADGTDSVTLHSAGGAFVSTPGFSYVTGTYNGGNFFIGALDVASLTGQATETGDVATFYSYAGNAFNGEVGLSSLTGSTSNIVGAAVAFLAQASGYLSVIAFESGTNSASLTSPGHGSLFNTPTATMLSVGTSTIVVSTEVFNGTAFVALPSQITVTGSGDGTDMAACTTDLAAQASLRREAMPR